MTLAERQSPSHKARIVLIQSRGRLLGFWVRLTVEHDTVHMCRRLCLQLCHSCALLWQLQLGRRSLVRISLCIEGAPCSCSRLGTLDTLGTAGEGR